MNDHARAVARIWARSAVRVAAAAALWFVLATAFATIALADPEPFVPGATIECAGKLVPLDPRVSIQNPLGTMVFEAFLRAMCGPPPPPAPKDLAELLLPPPPPR
jgi:hypothetical protein